MRCWISLFAAALFCATLGMSAANAALFDVTGARTGSAGGFRFSLFHSAASNGGKSGTILADITDVHGLFDSESGALSLSLALAGAGGPGATGVGHLDFTDSDGDGVLGSIAFTFASAIGGATDHEVSFLDFDYGIGPADARPNDLARSGPAAVIALWGAAGTPCLLSTACAEPGSFDVATTTIGMDVILDLEALPAPGALPVMAAGLLLLGLLAASRPEPSRTPEPYRAPARRTCRR